MFGQNINELPYNYYYYSSSSSPSQFQSHNFPPLPEIASATAHGTFPAGVSFPTEEYNDSFSTALPYTSSGCSSYGSPTSHYSFHNNVEPSYNYPNLSSSPPGLFFELDETTSVRRTDLQGLSLGQHSYSPNSLQNSPMATESSIIESMNRANPYSPEEKKERIERYRNKRNLRNFNKKIKYECRKTLADSRPRIRGRFARNDEIENKTPQSQWDPTGVEEYDDDDENWIGFIDSFSANVLP